MKKQKVNAIFLLTLITFFSSCSMENNGTSRLIVAITDSPGDYDSVIVNIQSVEINSNPDAAETDKGWTTLPNIQAGLIDLLHYTNGTELTLADLQYPTGKISQIMLVLGTGNYISTGGHAIELKTPSAQQSGLKLAINTTLTEGVTYKFTLDFDASKSIIKSGNGNYILKPVIKVISESQSGSLSGNVSPASENVAILVMSSPRDTVATSYAPAGKSDYLVPGVPAGAYDLVFDPGESSSYKMDTLKNVLVSLGTINKVDPVELSEK